MPAAQRTVTGSLPAQPQLRRDAAVLVSRAGDLRIALSARHSVTVLGATADLAAWLGSLDGTSSLDAALDRAPLHPTDAGFLLAELDRAGLLADANRGLVFTDPGREQHDALALARQVRGARGPVGRGLQVAISGTARWTGPVAEALQVPGISARQSGPEGAGLALIVIDAFDPRSLEPASAAMAMGTPHLVAVVSAVDAALLPLIIPGRTACRRCWALHRDPDGTEWAAVSLQQRQPAAPRLPRHHRALVLALVVEHCLAAADALRGPAPALAERYLDLRRGTVETRDIEPHPACGCVRIAA